MDKVWVWSSIKNMYNKSAYDKLRALSHSHITLKNYEKINTKYDYVIALPGLMTGLTDHFFNDLNSQVKYLKRSKIKVYICTWSWMPNMRIVNYIKNKKYTNLDIKIRVVDYESKELLEYFATIFKNWGVEFKGNVQRFIFKRYISQFIYSKCIEFIKEYEKEDILVLKIRSAVDVNKFDKALHTDELHNRNLSELWYTSTTNRRLLLGNLDNFVLSSVSTTGIAGDILFYSTLKNLSRVFGNSQDTAKGMFEYYYKEFKEYGGENLPKNDFELDHLHEYANFLMHYEGTGGLSYLIESANLVHFHDKNFLTRLFKVIGAPAVPYMSIQNYKLKVESKINSKEDTVHDPSRFLVNKNLGQKSLI